MSRAAALALGLVAATGAAAPLDDAIAAYDRTELDRARDLLVPLLEGGTLSAKERPLALIYLAASYHALGDTASAQVQLRRLSREAPAFRPDPGLFVPELVVLADQAAAEVAKEAPPERPRRAPPLATAFVPLGVGQFANGQSGKGALFLSAEVALFGAAAASLWMFESGKLEGGFLSWGRFADTGRAQTLQAFYLGAFWVGVAVAIGGVVDALVSRPSEPAAVSWRVGPGEVEVRF